MIVHPSGHEPSNRNRQVGHLVDELIRGVPAVAQGVVVSRDGLPIVATTNVDGDTADRLSAVASGLAGLSRGAAEWVNGGPVVEIIVEMANRFLFVSGIRDGSLLVLVVHPGADLGQVGYETTVLVDRIGTMLQGRHRPPEALNTLGHGTEPGRVGS